MQDERIAGIFPTKHSMVYAHGSLACTIQARYCNLALADCGVNHVDVLLSV